jgi:dTDP-4-amino-4,6-dideoxygalactose transaminase
LVRDSQVPFFDLTRNYLSIAGEIQAAFDRVFTRGSFILDEEVSALEREFATYIGSRFAVGGSSGTSALTIALQALGVGQGDEVITAANTAIPTFVAIVRAGAVPVPADVNEEDRNLDINAFENAISSRTKAVIPVHLYGEPCDMPSIIGIAEERGIEIVEDCAQAHGATIGNRRVGTFGDAGCFSFYPTKNLGAYGDGGMIVTDSEEVFRMAVMIRHHGQIAKDEHEVPGMCARLDEMQAAVLRAKLPRLDAWNERRREIAGRYLEGIRGMMLPRESHGRKGVYHLFVARTHRRAQLRQALTARGIATAIHYPKPAHLQKAFTFLGHVRGDFPVTETLSDEVLSLPIFPELTEEEVSRIIAAVNEILEERGH